MPAAAAGRMLPVGPPERPEGEEAAVDTTEQLETIAGDLKQLAGNVRVDQFGGPTPCARFRVRDLFDHLIGGATDFGAQLRGDEPPAVDPAALADEERLAALPGAIDGIVAATRAPGAMGRTVHLPFGAVPGSVLARFLTVDAMVHSWDLARSTGQRYDPPDELAEAVLVTARELIAPSLRDGDTFAAPTPVAGGAPALERLVAFTGRTL